MLKAKGLPINCAARNAVWIYQRLGSAEEVERAAKRWVERRG